MRYFLTLFILSPMLCLHAQNTLSVAKITASNRHTADAFGSCDIGEYYAVVGARFNDSLAFDAGCAYIYEINSNNSWNENQIITASDGANEDYFGNSVAISGNYAIIGAKNADIVDSSSATQANAGAAYIFERTVNGTWEEVIKLTAFDGNTDDYFGGTVAIYGRYAVVSAWHHGFDVNGSNFLYAAGAVYIYQRTDGGEWLFVQKITASDRVSGANFDRVSIHENRLVVGAWGAGTDFDNENLLQGAGSVYIFERQSGVWNETQKITPLVRHTNDSFGLSVDIFDQSIVIGASLEDFDLNGSNELSNTGAAYVFELNSNNQWEQAQRLVAPDREELDQYGQVVTIYGSYVLLGAYYGNSDENGESFLDNAGSTYLYERNNQNEWLLIDKIVAPDRSMYDQFGIAAAMYGANILIGATSEDEDSNGENTLNAAGSAYVFEIQNPVGLNENNTILCVSMYPNPTSGSISILHNGPPEQLRVTLKDVSGKFLDQQTFSGVEVIEYPIKESAGVYFIEISSAKETIVQRIVVE